MQIEELLKQNSKQIKEYISTISIQGRVVYTINVNVNENNKNEATNLNPIPR